MQLEQEGRLALNDPICKYLTPCPTEWAPITVHHLLSQTSGIFKVDRTEDFESQRMTPWTGEEISQKRRSGSLTFVPGERFEYNNSNYYFLGLIIEQVTGQPYATVLRQRILRPLGMQDTGLVSREHLVQSRASGYQLDAENQVGNSTGPMNPLWSFSAGAMYSTVEDMQKWGEGNPPLHSIGSALRKLSPSSLRARSGQEPPIHEIRAQWGDSCDRHEQLNS